jgi:hypothetical protein
MTLKKFIIGGAILILVLILGFSVKNIFTNNVNGGQDYSVNNVINVKTNNLATTRDNAVDIKSGIIPLGDIQNAKLALVDFSYKLTPNKLVKGVPVKIEVDASTLAGCMTTVVIKDFGVRKYITSKDNIIEFTPDKTGTFWITCSMGMGPGSFEVVNSDGTSDLNVAKTQATSQKILGGSCGASGGGCGCGGG